MINIILFNPEIPQNTGNIARTCAAIGASLHIIKPMGFSIDEKQIKRAGLDYWDKLDIHIYEDQEEFFQKNMNAEIYYITRYGNKRYTEVNYAEIDNVYIAFGAESKGIPKETLSNNFEKCLRVPILENSRSLNLSNCVALVSFEILRQKDFKGMSEFDSFKGKDFLK